MRAREGGGGTVSRTWCPSPHFASMGDDDDDDGGTVPGGGRSLGPGAAFPGKLFVLVQSFLVGAKMSVARLGKEKVLSVSARADLSRCVVKLWWFYPVQFSMRGTNSLLGHCTQQQPHLMGNNGEFYQVRSGLFLPTSCSRVLLLFWQNEKDEKLVGGRRELERDGGGAALLPFAGWLGGGGEEENGLSPSPADAPRRKGRGGGEKLHQ